MSLIKNRMLQYLEKNGISKYKCYKDTGITRGVLGNSSGITEDNIIKFVNFYSDIDLNWLIRGEEQTSKFEQEKSLTINPSLKDDLLQLLTLDKEIQKAFKLIIGKEINTFTSRKLLTLIKDESFYDAISKYMFDEKARKEL